MTVVFDRPVTLQSKAVVRFSSTLAGGYGYVLLTATIDVSMIDRVAAHRIHLMTLYRQSGNNDIQSDDNANKKKN